MSCSCGRPRHGRGWSVSSTRALVALVCVCSLASGAVSSAEHASDLATKSGAAPDQHITLCSPTAPTRTASLCLPSVNGCPFAPSQVLSHIASFDQHTTQGKDTAITIHCHSSLLKAAATLCEARVASALQQGGFQRKEALAKAAGQWHDFLSETGIKASLADHMHLALYEVVKGAAGQAPSSGSASSAK